ncbi:MAG: protein-tyrosine-phosphatase [Flavobacteriaceae bacterium]
MEVEKNQLFSDLMHTVESIQKMEIPEERKKVLEPLVGYLQEKSKAGESVRLNFICTHNSRRSHLSQVWAQTMAHYFGFGNVHCYSGGTEATALFPMVAQTLKGQGFKIHQVSNTQNPVYAIKYTENESPIIGFSKAYDDNFNPKGQFAAIMTCSQADEDCPFIPGAEKRIPLNYADPKAFDGTPQQTEKYLERSHQIAAEMWYVFSHVE